jgi:hypothetical protein
MAGTIQTSRIKGIILLSILFSNVLILKSNSSSCMPLIWVLFTASIAIDAKI